MYYKAVKKDEHYVQNHAREVPWQEVIAVIGQAQKYMRKKGEKIEIEYEDYYFLCELRNNDLYVINAKRKK